LVCQENDGRWYVHGATSFGASCSLKYDTVYTRINKYLDWIYKRIGGILKTDRQGQTDGATDGRTGT